MSTFYVYKILDSFLKRCPADRPTVKAGFNDLAYVTAEVVDAQGQFVTAAALPLSFQVRGVGKLAAVGNGNPTDMASFQQPQRTTYRGRCLSITQPGVNPGTITVKASAAGLGSGELTIQTR